MCHIVLYVPIKILLLKECCETLPGREGRPVRPPPVPGAVAAFQSPETPETRHQKYT